MKSNLSLVIESGVQARENAMWDDDSYRIMLNEIIESCALTTVFQPIIDMKSGAIMGYEGLIRGPSNSPLHAPIALFKTAEQHGRLLEIERLSRKVTIENFVKLNLVGKLFLNVSPECLIEPLFKEGETLKLIRQLGLNPERVIIELTEHQPMYDYPLLKEAVRHYRAMGFSIAIDDLGEGFSSLRLWSELKPDFIKVDMHFVQGINHDPVKHQFVSSIQQIAEKSGTRVIAEGIETQPELSIIKDIGIAFGQGYLIARPSSNPVVMVAPEILQTISRTKPSAHSNVMRQRGATAKKLLTRVAPVPSSTPNKNIFQIFFEDPDLYSLPVVDNGIPVGLLKRQFFIESFAKPFNHELFGKKACAVMMDSSPMIVDQDISLQDLSTLIVSSGRHHLFDGYIITDHGKYVGMGTGHDLMREITEIQITTARYANPLTLLPGNVPINEHIDSLLASGADFYACYCDLDNFKPFNDVYGYRKGDDLIQLTGQLLSAVGNGEHDFVGHIGGDDFIILFGSPDWEERSRKLLRDFDDSATELFSEEHKKEGGFVTHDRKGNQVFHPLTSLSIGAVQVSAGLYHSHHEISEAAAAAKKNAKKIQGSSLFIERRLPR